MSASRERKERASVKAVAQPQKKEKKKINEGLILAVSVIVILVAVFGTLAGIRYYQRHQTVMTVGDKDITTTEFNYFFNQTASNYGNYASYIGIDTTRTIDVQTVGSENVSMMSMLGMDIDCLEPYKQEDGTYDITWAGYFALVARETAAQTWAVYQAAMADANYTVSEEIETAISNEMTNVEFYGQIYGISADDFIEAQYGNGCNTKNYEQHVRISYIASDYASNYWFSDAEIDSKYESATADFDVVTFMAYTVSASEFLSTEEAEESTEEDTAAQAEAKEQAKAAAEAMLESFDAENSAVTIYADYTLDNAKGYTTEEAGTWLFETANIGDIQMFEDADNDTYYVVKLLANDVNYKTSNLLQLYIAADEETETTEDHEGHDHEEGEEAETTTLSAAEKVEAALASLAQDGSEENFRNLVTEYSSNSSANLDDVAYSYLENYIDSAALLWVLEGRQTGDIQTFDTDNGTYILYFVGESETYRNLSVNSALVSKWAEDLTTTAIENCNFDLSAAMHGTVDLTLTSTGEY